MYCIVMLHGLTSLLLCNRFVERTSLELLLHVWNVNGLSSVANVCKCAVECMYEFADLLSILSLFLYSPAHEETAGKGQPILAKQLS